MHDARTLDAARRGDRAARALLLRALQDIWYRFCLGVLHDSEQAREATQETALRFLDRLPQFRGDSQLKTWSLGIALNVTRELRRSQRTVSMDLMKSDQTDQRTVESPDSLASTAEERRLVTQVLGELPDRQREAVILRFFEELSVEETALTMKCAQGTVKATVHQALRALRERLTPGPKARQRDL